MTKLEPFAAYKDSGFEWLGSIPTHWNVVPSKWLFRLRTERPDSDAVHLMASQKYGVISQAQFMAEKDQRVVQTIVGGENMKKICIDDFLIHLRSFQGGIEWCANEGKVSPAYTVLRPNQGVHPPFFYYLLKSAGYIQELRATTNQLRDGQSMNYSQFAMVPLIEVPWDEQLSIAHFLDRETAQIDELISKQERLIQLLEEKHQAVITRAVTKGLDPTAPMKPSGIPWLGDVPAHWRVSALKRFLQMPISDGPHETPEFVDEGVPFVSAEAVSGGSIDFSKIRGFISSEDNRRYSRKYSPRYGDIYMVKSGATTGVTALVETEKEFNIWSPLAAIRCDESVLPQFLLAFLRSGPFLDSVALHWSFGTQQNIGMGVLGNLPVAIPPMDEQHQIAERVRLKFAAMQDLKLRCSRSIELLKERRSVLISAAVTGNIDITSKGGAA